MRCVIYEVRRTHSTAKLRRLLRVCARTRVYRDMRAMNMNCVCMVCNTRPERPVRRHAPSICTHTHECVFMCVVMT